MTLPYTGPASQSDNLIFLSVDTPESNNLVYQLWDGYSGAPGLLDDKSGQYVYDSDRKVYINTKTGRAVTDNQLARYVRNISNESSRRMKKNTQQLIAGVIMLSVWYSRMRDLMRALYKTIWILSIGGFVFEDDELRNAFYLFVLLQFNYLDNFAEQLYTGEQGMNGFAMTRAGMYGSYGNGLWQNTQLIQAEKSGYTECVNILGVSEDHCHDSERPGCIEQTARGWIPIADAILIGNRTCYSNCLCRFKFR